MRMHRALFLGLAVLLSGCASTLSTQVTSFHQLSDGLRGQRFVLTPADEQKASLEFDAYAGLVRQALVRKGLVDAGTERNSADLRVAIDYSVSAGSASTRGSSTTGYAGFGSGGGGFSFGSVGIGIGFPLGSSGGGAADSVVYQRSLQVQIERLANARPTPAGGTGPAETSRLFEARAISEGPSASLAPVMPAMVTAIFDEFPGTSGTTRVVRVPVDSAL